LISKSERGTGTGGGTGKSNAVNCWRNSGDAITSANIVLRLKPETVGDAGLELGISIKELEEKQEMDKK
jgi:hypothetical protein